MRESVGYQLIPHNDGERRIAEEITRTWDKAQLAGDVEPEELAELIAERLAHVAGMMSDF